MDERLKRVAAIFAVAGAGIVPIENALGSGFQLRENSASALGNAFAGGAVSTEDPSIIANNPAGMTDLSGNQVSSVLSIVIPSAIFSGMGLNVARRPIGACENGRIRQRTSRRERRGGSVTAVGNVRRLVLPAYARLN